MRSGHAFCLCVIPVVVLSIAAISMAQAPGGYGGYRPSAAATPTASPAVLAAQQEMQKARTALKEANSNVERYNKDAKVALGKDPKWVDANQALDAAKADRDRIHNEALDKLHQSDAYIQQQNKLKTAQAVIDDQVATVSAVNSATSDAIDARMAISQMETVATKKSPEVMDADAKYAAAEATVNTMFEQYKADELPKNQPWQAAIDAQAKAKADVDTAQNNLLAARQAAAAQYAQTAGATVRPQTGANGYRGSSSGSRGSSSGSRGSSSGSRGGYSSGGSRGYGGYGGMRGGY